MKLWTKREEMKYSPEELRITAATQSIGYTVVAFGLVGLIAIYFWADGLASHLPKDTPSLGRSAFVSADFLVAAAATAAGAALGFIFAIPRTLDPASHAAVAGAVSRDPVAATQAVNTNLERISDWLTTLLIGATLVQIKDIVAWVGTLGQNLLAGGTAANDSVVPIIVIYYFALAFLGVYLITRLYLTSAFRDTLTLLAGVRQPTRAVGELKQALDSAAQSSDSGVVKASLDSYDNWPLTRSESNDSDLNAKFARVLCKAMAIGAVSRTGNAVENVKNAVKAAATDGNIKAQLKTEHSQNKLSTGDATLDSEIGTILA